MNATGATEREAESREPESLGPPTYFRPPTDQLESIERVARMEKRSRSNAIVVLIAEALSIRRAQGKAA